MNDTLEMEGPVQLCVMFLSPHTIVNLNSPKAGNYKLKTKGRQRGLWSDAQAVGQSTEKSGSMYVNVTWIILSLCWSKVRTLVIFHPVMFVCSLCSKVRVCVEHESQLNLWSLCMFTMWDLKVFGKTMCLTKHWPKGSLSARGTHSLPFVFIHFTASVPSVFIL